MSATVKPERRPFNGSCHCGAVKYVVFLTVPRPPLSSAQDTPAVDRVYRCNCKICHKSGYMHVRPPSQADDFALLAPTDPFEQLGDYQCHDKRLHFFFCKICAVRCFTFMGEGHVVDAQPEELGLAGQDTIQVWRAKTPAPVAANARHAMCYLSVNAQTIDAGQDGFDMRDWVETKSVMYYDFLQDEEPGPGSEKPYPGGCY